MEIKKEDKFWMNNKLYQLWRFIVLNLKILKAVDHSKRSQHIVFDKAVRKFDLKELAICFVGSFLILFGVWMTVCEEKLLQALEKWENVQYK